MGSQFVDFNGDGHMDIVSATFDGSPYVAYGDAKGLAQPVHIMDAKGQRILISSIWNYETKKHEDVGRGFDTEKPPKERCISALAFDWDNDGDFDLLLGSYENGHLYRQMNEGSNAEPKFTGDNIVVMAGGSPFAVAGKMTAPRLVDWDADGDMDLIAGSFGDSYSSSTGGGVFLFQNEGKVGAPVFAQPVTLITVSKKGESSPTRPDAGLYVDATDYDGDGDLDLVVGGYSMWMPETRSLSVEEWSSLRVFQARQSELRKVRLAFNREIAAEVEEANAGRDARSDESRATARKIRAKFSKELKTMAKESAAVREQISVLVPSKQRRSFVWLYRRK